MKVEAMTVRLRLSLSAWSVEDRGRTMRFDVSIINMSDFFCLFTSHTEV